MHPTILAIESSCDETSAALIRNGKVLNNIIATQSVHEKYGGVVPELASRAHQKNIVPVVTDTLESVGVSVDELDAIAFTRGPGLMGALLVGTSFAKGLAQAMQIPLIEVNHLEAHVLAHFINDPKPEFPFLCFTVSGGHTQIVKVEAPLEMQVLGQTLDDAVGEAFDKTAKLLGLDYPGGPMLDKNAQLGNPKAFDFPISDMHDLNFSFSGIKTSVMYFINKNKQKNPAFIAENMADLCASIQYTLIQSLIKKVKKAVKETGIKRIAIAGGVSANSGLRGTLMELGKTKGWDIFIPEFEYCTDNAAMIAMVGHFKFLAGDFTDLSVSADPRLKINASLKA